MTKEFTRVFFRVEFNPVRIRLIFRVDFLESCLVLTTLWLIGSFLVSLVATHFVESREIDSLDVVLHVEWELGSLIEDIKHLHVILDEQLEINLGGLLETSEQLLFGESDSIVLPQGLALPRLQHLLLCFGQLVVLVVVVDDDGVVVHDNCVVVKYNGVVDLRSRSSKRRSLGLGGCLSNWFLGLLRFLSSSKQLVKLLLCLGRSRLGRLLRLLIVTVLSGGVSASSASSATLVWRFAWLIACCIFAASWLLASTTTHLIN